MPQGLITSLPLLEQRRGTALTERFRALYRGPPSGSFTHNKASSSPSQGEQERAHLKVNETNTVSGTQHLELLAKAPSQITNRHKGPWDPQVSQTTTSAGQNRCLAVPTPGSHFNTHPQPGATVRRCEAAERGPRGSHTQCKPSRRSATLVPAEEELGQRSSGRRIAERRARPHLHSRRGPAPLLRKSSTCHSNRRGKSRPPRHLLDGARRPARLIGGLPAGRRAGPCGAGSSGVAAECLRCAAPNLVSGSLIFF